MFARQVVIEVPRRPDEVRGALRRALADIDRATELFAELLPMAGADGPDLAFVGTVDVSAFHLRVVWPSSWFNRHGPVEVLGVVLPTPEGSRVTATIRRPRWFVVLFAGTALAAAAVMVSVGIETGAGNVLFMALVASVAALAESMRFTGDRSAAETALRRVIQPEGRGRLVWE